MANPLKSLTGLGQDLPQVVTIGALVITERFDLALASLAQRRGQEAGFAAAAKKAGVPLPASSCAAMAAVFGAFWVAPDMWMIEAPFASHEDIVSHLKPSFGETASLTEQTDAWTRFDLSGAAVLAVFERLTNLDLGQKPDGFASRTVVDHLGVYLIKRGAQDYTLYGPRSSAQSLLHALETAAKSVL